MQPSSPPSYHDDHPKQRSSRPSLSSASTVIPITPTSIHEHRSRQRAKTDFAQSAVHHLLHPNVGPRDAQRAPLHLDLASVTEISSTSLPTVYNFTPSAPIPIPPSRPKYWEDFPCTPLSARGNDSDKFSSLQKKLKPKYMSSPGECLRNSGTPSGLLLGPSS